MCTGVYTWVYMEAYRLGYGIWDGVEVGLYVFIFWESVICSVKCRDIP